MSNREAQQSEIERRARLLAQRLDLLASLGNEKSLSLVVLTDRVNPSPHSSLAKLDFTWADGASQAQINERVMTLLGKKKRDREDFRDNILAKLREAGLVEQVLVHSAGDRKADPSLPPIERGRWKGKSGTSSYALLPEVEDLLTRVPTDQFEAEVDKFVRSSPRRRELAAQHQTTKALDIPDVTSRHRILMERAKDAHIAWPALDGFKVIYIDDGDGDRIKEQWEVALAKSGLVLNLETRYPDVILVNWETRALWIIESVTSDGEADPIRVDEMSAWAAAAGWMLIGATTAYEDFKALARRQDKVPNLASGTHVWIARSAGQILEVKSVV